MDHGAAAAIAIAAGGLILDESAVGEGGRCPNLTANRTALGNADLDNVGPGGGGVITAEALVVAESACS